MGRYRTPQHTLDFAAEPIKGSRFVAHIAPIHNKQEASSAIQALAAQRPDASHHCWAWRLWEGKESRSADDGEPGGSAGKPILAQIEGHDLYNIIVVVTRYYGGTKLGFGGLIRAYGGTAGKALDQVPVVWVEETVTLDFTHQYEDTRAIDAALKKVDLQPSHTEFGAQVRIVVEVPLDQLEEVKKALLDYTSGRVLLS
jgi:uncharacterized YigZ family protein